MPDTSSRSPVVVPGTDGPLDPQSQRRNILVYSALVALIYLAAPIVYVGFVQAALFKRLHTSDTLANLPMTVYLGMAWFPVIVAWLIPEARRLKPVLSLSFWSMALMSAVVALLLLAPVSDRVVIAAVVMHAGLLGCANGVVFMLSWEALSRGVPERQRGKALALAFGWGPAFAVLGSMCAQMVLEGKFLEWKSPPWMAAPYPYNYALLFGGTALAMALAALLVSLYRIPLPASEPARQTFSQAMLGGFTSITRHRVLLLASVAFLLVSCGNTIQNNMSIFTMEAVGRTAEDLAGYQLALRFSFKMVAGLLLGWLLTRTHPKIPLLVTLGLQIAAVLWVLFVPGYWFLVAFGLNGAAELCGVYYMNYPVQCSKPIEVRANVAFLMLASSVVGVAPVFFGWISDHWGLPASFYAALGLLVFTAGLVWAKLPAHPKPMSQ